MEIPSVFLPLELTEYHSSGWHGSDEDPDLHTTVALISKSGVVLNKVHINKDREQQQPLRLRRV